MGGGVEEGVPEQSHGVGPETGLREVAAGHDLRLLHFYLFSLFFPLRGEKREREREREREKEREREREKEKGGCRMKD